MSLPRVKCFYDVVCPNSWITFQVLRTHSAAFECVEFEPVCDFKIGIIHNSDIWKQRRKVHNSRIWKPNKNEVEENPMEMEGILRKIDERGKTLIRCDRIEAPEDWKTTYQKAVSFGSIVPQLYLTSIKERCPDLYIDAIRHIGQRLWISKKAVHYGCHMSTVSRELGIPFRVAEDIVAKLSTPENRSILNKNCRDAVNMKLTEAPGILLSLESGETMKFENINELLRSEYISIPCNPLTPTVNSSSSNSCNINTS